MSAHQVNLAAYGNELLDAYNKVLSAQSKENWVLLGYEKNTNDLRVVSMVCNKLLKVFFASYIGRLYTIDGGLEELQEEFEESKVQYAFAKVLEPSTGLQKFVFINWVGDGVPVSKKALISSHVNDVKSRFRGFHVEISARMEADVEPSVIMKKVRDSSGAKYSHQQNDLKHVRKDLVDTSPQKPIEDQAQKLRAEREARDRELMAAAKQQQKQAEQVEVKINTANDVRREREAREKELIERERQSQKQRQEESKKIEENVLKSQSKNARNIWAEREKKSSNENISKSTEKLTLSDDQKKKEIEDQKKKEIEDQKRRELEDRKRRELEDQKKRDLEDQKRRELEDRKRRELEDQKKRELEDQKRRDLEDQKKRELEDQKRREDERKKLEHEIKSEKAIEITTEKVENLSIAPNSPGTSAKALYDYQAQESNEISLIEGEIIYQILQVDEGWWHGSKVDSNGQIIAAGLFPFNYVEIISAQPTAEASPAAMADNKMFAVKALYDYKASEENEISFNEGDLISQVEKVTDDWWSGVGPSGHAGLFPSNYVEVLK